MCTDSIAWNAPAAALPSWVESTISQAKPASSSEAPIAGISPNQASARHPGERAAERRRRLSRARRARRARGSSQISASIAAAPAQETVAVA